MAPSVIHHKGLLNGPGQNNCFLNSAVQVLWHLDIFRRSFRELSGHACMSDSCIFCALKDLFGQLQFSHERALPPDALRKALAHSFSDQHRFQLGFMDDAAECFENILLRIHFHIAYNEAEDMCNAKHCIPHQKFAMTLVEQSVCSVCHATSEPLPFTQMVHYVSASALISQAKQASGLSHPDLFGQLLKKAGGMGDIRDCPSACGAKIQIRRTLINRPEIVSVGIVWDSERPSLEHVMSLLDTLRVQLKLSDVFHGSFDTNSVDSTYHQLVGVVTYYGKHYSTFFFHTKLRVWVYFDDANVREVGPHWEHVVEKCRRGRYQPLLLLFATPSGTAIDTSHAPKVVTLVDKPSSMKSRSCTPALGGRRSITPSPEKRSTETTQRRSLTPNPQPHDYQNLAQYREAMLTHSNPSVNEERKELTRRDSGNWSGDRNSASSSSSTSLENPYHYIIGKMHRGYNEIPRSPNKNGDCSSGSGGNSSGGLADPGYDSFSISSTDSYPHQPSMKHNFQLAQIPETNQMSMTNISRDSSNNRHTDDCERLCAEADQLLDRSEHAEDLITALSLCNAAVNKARAAMDAPYSNPQTATFARMKHNACVMKARSLHRKLEEPLHNNIKYGENRHSRENSGCSGRGSTGSHSRQNSKDKTTTYNHSRQCSQDALDTIPVASQPKPLPEFKPVNEKVSPTKNIEIYATLPKSKKGLLSRSTSKAKFMVEDEEYLMKERPGRSLLSRSTKSPTKKEVEKRARSEERNLKNAKEPLIIAKEPVTNKKEKKQEEKQNKKQHKIRRKLLMGGLMRRKNRSMPDLRDDEICAKDSAKENGTKETKDDLMVNDKTAIKPGNLSGYLSEGNLEFAGNPNLERSKLMRKSFHCSKLLQFNKVPPPPPLRTTSQLSRSDSQYSNDSQQSDKSQVVYANNSSWCKEPLSLPYMPAKYGNDSKPKPEAITYANGGFLLQQPPVSTVVTQAQVHHEAFQSLPPSVDEPDFPTVAQDDVNFQLPPYPSPIGSVAHSRQASEDFPPPPNMLSELNEQTVSSFLSMLQEKRDKLNTQNVKSDHEVSSNGGESWLRELQAKQAQRRKMSNELDHCTNQVSSTELKMVKDLKARFESATISDTNEKVIAPAKEQASPILYPKKLEKPTEEPEEIKKSCFDNRESRRKSGKKKNVTFCEQVVLVATADEDEADGYIPNPILERVLRTVLHKDSKETETKEIATHSIVPLKRTDSWRLSKDLPLKPFHPEPETPPEIPPHQPKVNNIVSADVNQIHSSDNIPNKSNLHSAPENGVLNAPTESFNNSSYIPASSYLPTNTNADMPLRNTNSLPKEMHLESTNQNQFHPSFTAYQPAASYQPMSLQYYPSRSSPQRESNSPLQRTSPASLHPTVLARQNSTVGYFNNRPLVQQGGSKLSSNYGPVDYRPQNMNQKPPPYQQIPASAYHGVNQQKLSQTSYSDSLSRTSVSGISPYQPVPINSHAHVSHPTVNGDSQPHYGEAANVSYQCVPNSYGKNNYELQPKNTSYGYSSQDTIDGPPRSLVYQHISHPVMNEHTPLQPTNSAYHHVPHLDETKQNGSRSDPMNTHQHVQHQEDTYKYNSGRPETIYQSENQHQQRGSPYQHIPNSTNGIQYQPVPGSTNGTSSNYLLMQSKLRTQSRGALPPYQHPPPPTSKNAPYQRVPTPNQQLRMSTADHSQQPKYSPYQHPPMPKQTEEQRKSLERTNISLPCNLCRKRQITPPSVYCTDCDFYISRYKKQNS